MAEMLTEEEAAQVLKCSESWLRKQRLNGDNPPPSHRLGKRILRYDRDELLEWARSFDENGQSDYSD